MMPKDDFGRIRVIARVRPLIDHELVRGDAEVLHVEKKESVLIHKGSVAQKHAFAAAVGPEGKQEDLFKASQVTQLINQVLQGYCGCVFAYGQTGSGKTYTMVGPGDDLSQMYPGERGLILRSIEHLFHQTSKPQFRNTTVRASFCELYKEQIYDLLNVSGGNLPIRWTRGKGFFVENLFVVQCNSVNDLFTVLNEGMRNRVTGSHDMNRESSRSHAIFTIYIESIQKSGPDMNSVKGKLTFVDLAGSERLKESGSEQVNETTSINKSLFMLGKVISCLSMGVKPNHVPYRDSKLTKLLMDSLGGNGMAMMIATLSPSARYVEDSELCLHYAMRAQNIQNRPIQQLDPADKEVTELKRIISQQKFEILYLKKKLTDLNVHLYSSWPPPDLDIAGIKTMERTISDDIQFSPDDVGSPQSVRMSFPSSLRPPSHLPHLSPPSTIGSLGDDTIPIPKRTARREVTQSFLPGGRLHPLLPAGAKSVPPHSRVASRMQDFKRSSLNRPSQRESIPIQDGLPAGVDIATIDRIKEENNHLTKALHDMQIRLQRQSRMSAYNSAPPSNRRSQSEILGLKQSNSSLIQQVRELQATERNLKGKLTRE